jgi:hypothetical protein
MVKLLDNLRKKHAAAQPKVARHTVNFLAHRDEIAGAMKEGWTAKQIWEQMIEDGMTSMSYASFCRHVKTKIMSRMDDADGSVPSANAYPAPSRTQTETRENTAAKKSSAPAKKSRKKNASTS